MKRLGYRHVVGLVLGHAPRGVKDIHHDSDDVWAYEPEKRAALEAWADYIRKVAALDESQLCLHLARPAANVQAGGNRAAASLLTCRIAAHHAR